MKIPRGPRGLLRRGLASMPFQAANTEHREQSPKPRLSFAPGSTRPEGSKPARRSLTVATAVDRYMTSSSSSLMSGQSMRLPMPSSSVISFPSADGTLQEKSPSSGSDWSSSRDGVTPRFHVVAEAANDQDATSKAAAARKLPSEDSAVQLPGQCMLESETEATASENEGSSLNGDQSEARVTTSRPNRRVRFAPDSKTPKPSSLIQMLSLVREVSDQFQDGKK